MEPLEESRSNRDSAPQEEEDDFARHLPSKLGKLLPWFNCFYIIDYLTLLVIIILLLLVRFIQPSENFADALDRLPEDTILQFYNYPIKDELWSNGLELVVYLVIPLSCFIIAQIWVLSLHDFHNALLGFFFSILMASLFTEVAKRVFGFLRPNYLERIDEYDDDEDTEYRDARMSFPSGHTTTVTAGLFFLSLYFLGKLRPFHHKDGDGFFFQFIIIIAPTCMAIYVSATRIVEFQHFFMDVFAGWMIGIFFAVSCYCLVFYPPLWHKKDGRPKAKASRNVQSVFYRKLKNKSLPCMPKKGE